MIQLGTWPGCCMIRGCWNDQKCEMEKIGWKLLGGREVRPCLSPSPGRVALNCSIGCALYKQHTIWDDPAEGYALVRWPLGLLGRRTRSTECHGLFCWSGYLDRWAHISQFCPRLSLSWCTFVSPVVPSATLLSSQTVQATARLIGRKGQPHHVISLLENLQWISVVLRKKTQILRPKRPHEVGPLSPPTTLSQRACAGHPLWWPAPARLFPCSLLFGLRSDWKLPPQRDLPWRPRLSGPLPVAFSL